jgi:KTSC domain
LTDSVKMIPVTSSNVESVGHDGAALFVQFKDKDGKPGRTYRYPGVSTTHHTALVAAKSPGGYFAKHIRGAHVGERVGGK